MGWEILLKGHGGGNIRFGDIEIESGRTDEKAMKERKEKLDKHLKELIKLRKEFVIE